MFQDLNDLFFLFVEKSGKERRNITKRVYIQKQAASLKRKTMRIF
jgi:hypothetical protein